MPSPLDVPNRKAAEPRQIEWHLSRHAYLRAAELGYTEDEVLECAKDPNLKYETDARKYRAGEWVHKRGDVAVVTRPDVREIVTVLLPTTRDWKHGRDKRS